MIRRMRANARHNIERSYIPCIRYIQPKKDFSKPNNWVQIRIGFVGCTNHEQQGHHATRMFKSNSFLGRTGGNWLGSSEGYFVEWFHLIKFNLYLRFCRVDSTRNKKLLNKLGMKRQWTMQTSAASHKVISQCNQTNLNMFFFIRKSL